MVLTEPNEPVWHLSLPFIADKEQCMFFHQHEHFLFFFDKTRLSQALVHVLVALATELPDQGFLDPRDDVLVLNDMN